MKNEIFTRAEKLGLTLQYDAEQWYVFDKGFHEGRVPVNESLLPHLSAVRMFLEGWESCIKVNDYILSQKAQGE